LTADHVESEGAIRLVREFVRTHPAPRYLVSGGLTFLVDFGVLGFLHSIAHLDLVLATIAAFVCGFAVNFTLSRHWTFASGKGGDPKRQLRRFLVLVGFNLVSTVVLVAGIAALGENYLIAKVIATALNASCNFFVYRHWVFASSPQNSSSFTP
jgi:putative flippase GtrA